MTFMDIVWGIVFLLVGYLFCTLSLLQILMTLFCSLPMTARLRKIGAIKGKGITRIHIFTIFIHLVIGAAICIPIFLFATAPMKIGFVVGTGFIFLLSLGKVGMTPNNVEDYMKSNARHIDFDVLEQHQL